MAKPMIEWIEHPDNQAMFEEIEDQVYLMKSRGEGAGTRVAVDGVVLIAAHQPRQPDSVYPAKRPVHLSHDCRW